MAMSPLFKPTNPCVADIKGMFIGKSIYVCGKIHDNADRFAINLQCGPDDEDDIALHINPRFPAGEIVRNTRKGGWGSEEREGNGFPFKQGKLFGLTITCRSNGYEIKANGYRVYTTYEHRIPFHTVTHVQVCQDCDVQLICTGIEGVDVPAYEVSNPQGPIEIPFHNIREHSVVIFGKPTNGNSRFSINFKGGKKNHFHFNPRLNEGEIVRNTNDDESWGDEDRDLGMKFPFAEGVPFEVKITVERQKYVVYINGEFAFDYPKRLKWLKGIRNIAIHGDAEIQKVVFY